MPPEIVALIDKPWLLALVLGIGAVCGMAVERVVEHMKRAERRAYWQGRNHGKKRDGKPARPQIRVVEKPVDLAADQLRVVMSANFEARALLNSSERRLFSVIDQALQAETPGWRVMGQVSLGEILSSKDKDAFLAINSKRVDLLIVDADCRPLHAIEFQGTGHHLGNNTAARDAVKKEALRRAGIGYVEVVSGDRPAEVHEMIKKLVRRLEASA